MRIRNCRSEMRRGARPWDKMYGTHRHTPREQVTGSTKF